MTDVVYALAGAELAPALEHERERAEARRVEAEYRRAERAAIADDALDASERAASSVANPEGVLSPRVFGITDPASGLGTVFQKETEGFRTAKATRHRAIAETRRNSADDLDQRLASIAVRAAEVPEAEPGEELRSMLTAALDQIAELAGGSPASARHASALGLMVDGEPVSVKDGPLALEQIDRVAAFAASQRRSAEWHEGRARGELERVERIDHCGVDQGVWTCAPSQQGCGAAGVMAMRCGSKFCAVCRGHAAAIARMRFGIGRLERLRMIRTRGLLRHNRKGGRWSEKFATFTVPHVGWSDIDWSAIPEGVDAPPLSVGDLCRDAVARIWLLQTAYRVFNTRLNKWLRGTKKDPGPAPGSARDPGSIRFLVALHKSFEWTPGSDGLGHPHFHCYLFSPLLPRPDELQEWWADSLRVAGYRGEQEPIAPWVVEIKTRPHDIAREVDKGKGHNLRIVSGGERVHAYACGWTIAEYATGEKRASEAVLARVYEAITDRKLNASSPKFLPPRLRGCPQCGIIGAVSIEVRPGEDAADLLERIAIACDGGCCPPSMAAKSTN